MADIELVIKISEEKYNAIKSDLYRTFPAEMKECGLEAIRNGIQLPKGHGRLIDADAYRKDMQVSREFNFFATLDLQPTIIEADAESEEQA